MVESSAREGTGRWGHDGRASGGALAGLPLERIAKMWLTKRGNTSVKRWRSWRCWWRSYGRDQSDKGGEARELDGGGARGGASSGVLGRERARKGRE